VDHPRWWLPAAASAAVLGVLGWVLIADRPSLTSGPLPPLRAPVGRLLANLTREGARPTRLPGISGASDLVLLASGELFRRTMWCAW
jgi:hypothetical protein